MGLDLSPFCYEPIERFKKHKCSCEVQMTSRSDEFDDGLCGQSARARKACVTSVC